MSVFKVVKGYSMETVLQVDFDKRIALSIHPSSTMLVLCRVVGMLEPISPSKAGMGNFESDEGQYFFLLYTKGSDY